MQLCLTQCRVFVNANAHITGYVMRKLKMSMPTTGIMSHFCQNGKSVLCNNAVAPSAAVSLDIKENVETIWMKTNCYQW